MVMGAFVTSRGKNFFLAMGIIVLIIPVGCQLNRGSTDGVATDATIPSQRQRPGFTGNGSSGGGEYLTYQENPWFIGPDPVTYCILKSDQVSISKEHASELIRKSLADWENTISDLRPRPTGAEVLDGRPKTITTSFVESDCDSATELVFNLGNMDQKVSAVLGDNAPITVAIAHQSSFDQSTGRAKGFIWLTPDEGTQVYKGPKYRDTKFWSYDPTFFNVILHELGHVFGFKHQAGVMVEWEPADQVQSGPNFPFLYTSRSYVDQRWSSRLPGQSSVCGNALVLQDPELHTAIDPDAKAKWTACLSWDSDSQFSLKLVSSNGLSKQIPIRQLITTSQWNLEEVRGYYRRNDGALLPGYQQFITPYTEILTGAFSTEKGVHSVVISSGPDKITVSYVNASSSTAGNITLYISGGSLVEKLAGRP
jgi:hypothetical protein